MKITLGDRISHLFGNPTLHKCFGGLPHCWHIKKQEEHYEYKECCKCDCHAARHKRRLDRHGRYAPKEDYIYSDKWEDWDGGWYSVG